MKTKVVTLDDLKQLNKVKQYSDSYEEIMHRIDYFYLQTDGSYMLPDSVEGDILKIFISKFMLGGK